MFPNNTIPSNMSTAVNGTLQSETIGWDHRSDAKVFVLLPVTLVALLSIIAIVTSIKPARLVLQDNKSADGVDDAISFNFSDPMHLVFATAAGNLGNALENFRKSDVAKAEKIRVRLKYINDEKIGLVTDSVC